MKTCFENYKIGDKIPFGRLTLKVVKSDDCSKCIFDGICDNGDLTLEAFGSCSSKEREDKTDVIFVKDND